MTNQSNASGAPPASASRIAIPPIGGASSSASEDPLSVMLRITKDSDLNDEQKFRLLEYCGVRFKHRRRIAYISFCSILASLGLVFVAAFVDGLCKTEILAKVASASTLIGTIEFFLTAIVAAYYGMSTWRPSS